MFYLVLYCVFICVFYMFMLYWKVYLYLSPPPLSHIYTHNTHFISNTLTYISYQYKYAHRWLEAPSSKLLNKFHIAASALVNSNRSDDEPSLLKSIYSEVVDLRQSVTELFRGY